MARRKYIYKNIVVEKYWNSYRTYYDFGNGNKELIAVGGLLKANAYKIGKQIVDFMNAREAI